MTLRRRTPLRPSRGTVIDPDVRRAVMERDQGCVLRRIVPMHTCVGGLELDHVRASGAMGMKSPSVPANLVVLCAEAHRTKTNEGRTYRPLLIAYLDEVLARSETIG